MEASEAQLRALDALGNGPCPDEAIARALGLDPAHLEAPLAVPLAQLLHQGSYPARLLTLVPTSIDVMSAEPLPSPTVNELRDRLASYTADVGLAEALGRVRTREYLRLCRAEVEGASLEEVGGALCRLAEACIEQCLAHHGLQDQVAVFGMGKLGGRELNFLSDIDLVFVHADELGESGPDDRRATVRLHDKLRKVVRLLEGEGRFRPVFRVDLRLRPFGARGALSLSSSATEAYYERHGRAWERQVWLRARPVGGNAELAAALLQRLSPFVYRKSVSVEIFDEIASLMQRARRRRTATGREDIDLKLDEGGIRTIEFSVQALQLLHGGRDRTLRSRNTLRALDRLFAAGLLSDREHRELQRAYRWLRRVEHRLQLTDGAHTHSLPEGADALRLLARRLAAPRDPLPPDAAAFLEALDEARRIASAVASSIAGPVAQAEPDPRAPDRDLVLDAGAPPELRKRALGRLGLRDPEEADALLQHLASRTDGALSSRSSARAGIEALLRACLDSADPDGALARLVEFAAHRPAHYGIWRFLSQPGPAGRDIVRLTAELFGTSAPLSRGLIGFAQPQGALEDESIGLLMEASLATLPDRASIAADADGMTPDRRGFEVTVRKFKEQQLVSIALFDLGQRPDALEVGRSLSALADTCVRMVLREVVAETAADRPAAHGLRLGVFALGKYGMEAMDYGSDLDLIFVYDGAPSQREAIRLGQRLLTRLSERRHGVRLYEVDMRLRPSGRQGLLVSSLSGFTRYHDKSLPVWESLALVRLRSIGEATVDPDLQPPLALATAHGTKVAAATPGPLCEAVESVVSATLARTPSPAEVGSAVRRLKQRIEREIARENREAGLLNPKTGVGGSLELELLVAALGLLNPEPARPPRRGVIEQIEALEQVGTFRPAEARELSSAYRFQRRFLNRLRMSPPAAGADADRFAQNSPRLITLARRMGLASRRDLLAQFEATTRVVRAAFDEHLDG